MNNNIIWFNNINILFNKDTFGEIIPTSAMNNSQKINSITRFTLYLSILLYLVSGNYLYFYIVLITILITYLVYVFNNKENFDENSEREDGTNYKIRCSFSVRYGNGRKLVRSSLILFSNKKYI